VHLGPKVGVMGTPCPCYVLRVSTRYRYRVRSDVWLRHYSFVALPKASTRSPRDGSPCVYLLSASCVRQVCCCVLRPGSLGTCLGPFGERVALGLGRVLGVDVAERHSFREDMGLLCTAGPLGTYGTPASLRD